MIDILRRVRILRRIAALLVPLALVACGNVLSAAAAVVNGERISLDEVEDRVRTALQNAQGGGAQARAQAARTVLIGLIQRELLSQEAERRSIRVTEQQIAQEIAQLEAQFGGPQGLAEQVRRAGLDDAELRDRIRDQLLVDQLQAQLAPVTDAQVRAQYNTDRQSFRQIRVKHILLRTDNKTPARALQQARAALARIRGGESFEAVARAVSEDPSSKPRGGELTGWVGLFDYQEQRPTLDSAFAEAAWRAPLRVVTAPVRSQFGYHLILTTAKRILPYQQVRDQVRERVEQNVGRPKLEAFIRDLVVAADIDINPRYGEWDRATADIVERTFYEPPTVEPNEPQPSPAPIDLEGGGQGQPPPSGP